MPSMAAMVANVCFGSNAHKSPPRTIDRAMRGENRWYATRICGVIDGERIAEDAKTLTRDKRRAVYDTIRELWTS